MAGFDNDRFGQRAFLAVQRASPYPLQHQEVAAVIERGER